MGSNLLSCCQLGCGGRVRAQRTQRSTEPFAKPFRRTVAANVDGEVDRSGIDLHVSVVTKELIRFAAQPRVGLGSCFAHRGKRSGSGRR